MNLTSDLVILILGLVTVIGALKVVMTRSIIHAAFWLFPVFAGIAAFYLFLGAQFLAAIQVLIYIGAILVLIIFAVTLTRNAMDSDDAQSNRLVVPVALAALLLLVALGGAILTTGWYPAVASLTHVGLTAALNVTDIAALGVVFLQQYLLPFEIASVLLLAGMIGAIVLARKERAADATAATAADAQPGTLETREPAEVK
jgi:NADH-quinone oxidoreductase subunit J